MAQHKIQKVVGTNLPPLKNDLIIEKKKEMEEYLRFKELKAKMREEKRLQKLREKEQRKKSQRLSGITSSRGIDTPSRRVASPSNSIEK
jgi:hypothetical protein